VREPVRVSTILARLQDFGDIPKDILQNKANIGTDVHAAISAQANREWFPLEEERRIAYFESYGQWHAMANPAYYMTDKRCYDYNLGITGAVDAVVQLKPNGPMHLIDFKTSAKESLSRDGLSIWNMQAHLYFHLLKVNGIPVTTEFHWIQLRTKMSIDGYLGTNPKTFVYKYEHAIMERCLEEVHKYWEEYDNAKIFN
jgi:hypothetical protein